MKSISSKSISQLRELNPKLEHLYDKLIKRLIEGHLIGSTLVEGSTFTEYQAQQVLNGKVIHGHAVDEHLELTNGIQSASYIHRIFLQHELITTKHIDQAHKILMSGIGKPRDKTPGKNRGATNLSAYTMRTEGSKLVEVQYANPIEVKEQYQAFLDFHINKHLASNRKLAIGALAKLYFHFQMLHPYTDGNGRIGRFLVSAKVASELGYFFRFELNDGPEHLKIMMQMTGQYVKDKAKISYSHLEKFLDKHLTSL
ncbi:Fic family protein [bacterium]|nr:Fic family protein [bacterium]